MIDIDNKAKLHAFRPVRIPKPKDIFKRRGFIENTSNSSLSADDFSRNPLEQHQRQDRDFNNFAYQQYALEEAEKAKAAEAEKAKAAESDKANAAEVDKSDKV